MEDEEKKRYTKPVKMQTNQVQKQVEAMVECEVEDAIDLSVDIPWTAKELDCREELNDHKQEVKPMEAP